MRVAIRETQLPGHDACNDGALILAASGDDGQQTDTPGK